MIEEVVPQFLPRDGVQTVSQTIADYYVERGREQGRQEGQRELLLHQLHYLRFGTVPPEVSKRLHSIEGLGRLEELSRRLFDTNSLEGLGPN